MCGVGEPDVAADQCVGLQTREKFPHFGPCGPHLKSKV